MEIAWTDSTLDIVQGQGQGDSVTLKVSPFTTILTVKSYIPALLTY